MLVNCVILIPLVLWRLIMGHRSQKCVKIITLFTVIPM
ncbi:hypothetical protein RBY4I_338 [Rhodobacterales bacterium Y4I]|nr:hypothetical protein RBY4I_338 [Rhodobacterales bacterium Y4I]